MAIYYYKHGSLTFSNKNNTNWFYGTASNLILCFLVFYHEC
jgi:hypothetical protein